MKIDKDDICVSDGSPCGYQECQNLGNITVSGKEYCKAHFKKQFLSGQSGGAFVHDILVELLIAKVEADEDKRLASLRTP
jgi:hypothetical protein